MWSDRKPEDPTLRRVPATHEKSDSLQDSAGPVTPSHAVIGKAMVIKGHIRSRENMHVDGEVEGTLELSNSRLTIGPNGKVAANASAREVEVIGSITGDVEATHKITIRKGGRLIGDLKTPGIVIEDGAYFKGKIEIGTSEAQVDTKIPEPIRKSAAGV